MILVDANVWIDVIQDDPTWGSWSAKELARARNRDEVAINPIIVAEVSLAFASPEDLDRYLGASLVQRLPLPYAAAFSAGRAFVRYRQSGGQRHSPLPDFYIGAHAEADGLALLTRDAARYRTYFPTIKLIAPKDPAR